MNREFFELACRIATLASEKGLAISDLLELLGQGPGEISCYPGWFSEPCCEIAVFVSIHGNFAKKKWPLDFETMLQNVVQHMQGKCSETTQHVGIITDSWLAPIFERWETNLRTISRSARLEIYLIGHPGWVAQVNF
jgi:hypothetical protein